MKNALLVMAFALIAQQTPTFRSGVDLVQVDVVVVDKDGHAVRGLTQTDFTIRDRRKAQAIATFQEIGREPRASAAEAPPMPPSVRLDVASNATSQADRLVIVVIDDLHIWKGRTDRAKEISRDVVTRLGAQASMAVLFTSGDHSTNVTADHSILLAAIDTLKARQSWKRPHPAIDNQRPPHVDPEEPASAVMDQFSDAGKVTAQDFFDNMQQYATMKNAAKMLGGEDTRRKAFVLISEGVGKDLSGLFGPMTAEGDVPQGGQAYASGDAVAFAASSLATVPQLHTLAILEMMEALRRANVATYAIDPRGAVKAGDLASECFPAPKAGNDPCVDDSAGPNAWMSPVRQAQSGLVETAVATGGFAVTNTDDFTGGLSRILDDLDHYYVIGFYPSDPNGKGYRPLAVQIAGHPDWTLRYRRGYMGGSAAPAAKTKDAMLALSSSILPKSDLPLRLTAIATPGTNGSAHVTLGLEVSAPLATLQEKDGKVRDTLKYEVLVVDEKKAKVRSIGGLEGRLTLSPKANAGAPPETVTYMLLHDVDVTPGPFEFRVSATSAKLAKGGSVYLDVDVPDFRSAPIVLGGLVVGYADGAHVPVAPTVAPAAVPAGTPPAIRSMRGAPAPPPPPSVRPPQALPFAPTLDRTFRSADTLSVFTEAAVRDGLHPAASIDIVDASGKVVSSVTPAVSAGSLVRLGANVPLRGLTPGPYILRVALTDGQQSSKAETAIVIK
jgi:VWFA-related protein